jgi:hypothetical protein
VTTVGVEEVDESAVGVHFGLDVNYMVNKRFGVGGMARYVWGSADVENAGDKLSLGGFQISSFTARARSAKSHCSISPGPSNTRKRSPRCRR